MSANGDESDDARPGREVAHRLFAAEFDDSSLSYAESDEERAPNYVISPTGARLNRVFVVGTLTEVTDVNEEMVRARVVDPTGAFVVYAGQYQPEALAFLERAEPPAFVAVTGKARTFEPEDGDQVYTSIRPESLATVDADTRDRWVVDTAEHTLDRIETYAAAAELDVTGPALTDVLRANGVSPGFAEGIPLAQSHYGTTPTYLAALRTVVVGGVRVVAGERSQVDASVGSPDSTSPDGPAFASLVGDDATLSVPEEFELDTVEEAEAAVDPETVDSETDAAAGAAVGTATATTTTEEDETSVERSVQESDESAEAPSASDAATESDGSTTESEPTTDDAEPESDATDAALERDSTDAREGDTATETATDDDLGDFDAGDSSDEPDGADDADEGADEPVDVDEAADEPVDEDEAAVDADDFDDGMYELDEEEREQIESEYGTDFTTGAEVDDPGEADIDVPDPEDVMPEDADESDGEAGERDSDGGATDEETDVDLQARVVAAMDELDDGEGAERSAVVDAVADETGADEDAIEQAIQDALMGGECFEPSDGRLQAI